MKSQVTALERFARRGLDAQAAVDRAIERGNLVRKLHAARRTERALRDELRAAELALQDGAMRLGFAQLALDEFDREGRAPA